MGVFIDRLLGRGGESSEPKPFRQVLAENDWEIVEVLGGEFTDQPVVLATPKKSATAQDLKELGASAPGPFNYWMHREYNNELRGVSGLRKYNEMRRSDSTVRATLRLLKTPILNARWFIEPASDSARDKNIADFVWWNLTEGMTTSWPQFLNEVMLMLDYGYYTFEKVYTNTHPLKPGKICWKKFGPRHPLDILDWKYDDNGGPAFCEMYTPRLTPDGEREDNKITIPISKLAVFTFDKEGGDIAGTSVLRSAYKPWYYKSQLEKIDAIQKERHGIGVPIIKLPIGFSSDDKKFAENLGRNLRTNERAHVTLPPGWDIAFAKLEGQPVSALDSIKYHDKAIEKNVLAPFMDEGAKEEDQDIFLKGARFVADIVLDVFNKYCIPQLVNFNWGAKAYPKLRARRIGEQGDWRTMSFAVRNYVGAGVITPDEELEKSIRQDMDLPPADIESRREVATPQGGPGDDEDEDKGDGKGDDKKGPMSKAKPPRVGPPRQSKPTPNKPASKPRGGDQSGGK
jgi:hypothetical protein